MGSKMQAFFLLLIIAALVSGTLYFFEYEQIFAISDSARLVGRKIPYVKDYIGGTERPPAEELAELEQLHERKDFEADQALLRKNEEKLKTAEEELNSERQKLSQWEGELERREEALKGRETEFDDKEKRYEKAVKFYLTMKPAAAAQILSKQDDMMVIEVFRRMPERNVAAIMAEMDPIVAGAIMRKMSR